MSDNLPSPDNAGYVGERELDSGSSDFNAQAFLIKQILSRISTATLVQVKAVTNAGGVSPVGFVDVHPLVNQLDGLGNAVPHGIIYDIPYFRVQGGTDAIILDPKVDDIGLVVFADHDLSTVKATKKEANPGSRRRFDMADGIYIGGVLNGTPAQYVRFSTAGIDLLSPTKITLTAPIIEAHGDFHGFNVVIAGFGGADQVGLQTHTHAQGNDSNGDSESPTNAPTAGT